MEQDEDPFAFKGLEYITEAADSKALNSRKEPCIIISASGMAEFGRIKHHIANNIENPNNTILIVGYCEPNSLGARLQSDDLEVRIFGEFFKKNAELRRIRSFSAHADYSDLLYFLSCQDAKKVEKVFLVHGEYNVQLQFKKKLIKKGFDFVEIPDFKQEITI
jgi:metallo-beta-lactamase family protein